MRPRSLFSLAAIVVAVILGAAFVQFVWPTRYRYFEHVPGIPVRMDRLAFEIQVWGAGGWRTYPPKR